MLRAFAVPSAIMLHALSLRRLRRRSEPEAVRRYTRAAARLGTSFANSVLRR
jgi:hypothetical protein